ncbi:pirin family protein [Lentisphaera marina]|uniref:pirin family protein n=1 Tax=Lentisphaera marina TaxID=1111041 RepID=UPI002366F277|nr:pirin family protein [Lentisphaera marina]MDD7983501.1 pirin family protein [Lentisphaera marina]
MKIHRAEDRGHVNHDWLEAKHSFSFGEYYNPRAMRFGSLRVLNEDLVEPGQGFGMHPHQDAEILTYVLSGKIKHEDSMGHGGVISHGEIQYMSAGSGVRHSEFNASESEAVHLYQIWVLPNEKGLEPRYEQKKFPPEGRLNQWQLIASPLGENNSFRIAQDVKFYATELEAEHSLDYELQSNRQLWLQVAKGSVNICGHELRSGDGVSFEKAQEINITALNNSEILLFNMA